MGFQECLFLINFASLFMILYNPTNLSDLPVNSFKSMLTTQLELTTIQLNLSSILFIFLESVVSYFIQL